MTCKSEVFWRFTIQWHLAERAALFTAKWGYPFTGYIGDIYVCLCGHFTGWIHSITLSKCDIWSQFRADNGLGNGSLESRHQFLSSAPLWASFTPDFTYRVCQLNSLAFTQAVRTFTHPIIDVNVRHSHKDSLDEYFRDMQKTYKTLCQLKHPELEAAYSQYPKQNTI